MALDSGVKYISYASAGELEYEQTDAFRLCRLAGPDDAMPPHDDPSQHEPPPVPINRRFRRCRENQRPDGVFYTDSNPGNNRMPQIADFHHSQSLRVIAGGTIADGDFVRPGIQGRVVSDGQNQTRHSVARCIGPRGGTYRSGEICQIVPLC